MADAAGLVLAEDAGGVRCLTLNRPAKRNALSRDLIEALCEALDAAAGEATVAVVVITAAGPAFCAGVDLGEMAEMRDEAAFQAHANRLSGLFATLEALRKPTIAAVDGPALGAGCGLALGCATVVASSAARFGYPEIEHGLTPALVLPGLVARVGPHRAFEMLAGGGRYDAGFMAAAGAVQLQVAAGEARTAALALARRLAGFDPAVIAAIKTLIEETQSLSFEDAMARARALNVAARRARLARSSGR